jgi:hypothetical protein
MLTPARAAPPERMRKNSRRSARARAILSRSRSSTGTSLSGGDAARRIGGSVQAAQAEEDPTDNAPPS